VRSNNLPFAVLLVTLIVSVAVGQTSSTDARESIKRGNAKYSQAQYLAAIEEYQRVQPQPGKTYSQALYNIGVCYYELWRPEEAIAMYQKAVASRGGNYPIALYALGVALEEVKRLEEAKQSYRLVVAALQDRYGAAAHFRLGLLLAGEGEYDQAATHFTEAITRDSSPAGHNNLGVVLALKGHLQEAEKEFEVALKQANGVFTDATNNLKLCRSLLADSAKEALTSLRLVATTRASGK
jgi:tetratricopeptide (TPR) repeat protein